MIDYLFGKYSVSAVMFLCVLFVAYLRKRNGGDFLNPDQNVRDALNGVGLYILAIIGTCIILGPEYIAEAVDDNFGVISVNASFFLVALQRADGLRKSALNLIHSK